MSNTAESSRDDPGISWAAVLYFVSIITAVMGAFMLLPGLFDLADHHADSSIFFLCAFGCLFVGIGSAIAMRGGHLHVRQSETLLLLPITWIFSCLVSSLPFMLSSMNMSFADAVFETVSGLTNTGSSVITGLDTAPRGILFWRFLLQWIGGFGVVTIAVLALPFLRIGGLQLFSLDLSPQSSKFLPRITEVISQIGMIYIALTIACAISYWLAGMNAFDAIGHAMTTLATGGYSSHDSGIGFFESPAIEWIAVLFMALGAMPFGHYIMILLGRPDAFYKDQQVQLFLGIILACVAMLTAWRMAQANIPLMQAIREAAFVTVNTITTTGYSDYDFSSWGGFPDTLAFILMLVGGCTGSTVGGIKVFRIHAMLQMLRAQVHRQIYPHGTFRVTFNGVLIPETVRAGVANYVFIYLLLLAGLALALSATGLSFGESMGAAATALGNNGPGLGPVIGPCCSFQTVSEPAKWLMSFGMLAGRLEILILIIPFSRAFWRS